MTAVAQALVNHWVGGSIDANTIITVALIHDLGNLIKFKRPFLGELEQDAEYWTKKQDELRGKYGNDVHQATLALAKQEAFSPEILIELDRTGMSGSLEKFSTNEARIIELADMCVSPVGIVGPSERIDDLLKRYGDRVHLVDLQRHKENVEIVSNQLDQPLEAVLKAISQQDIEKLSSFEIGSK